MHARNDNPVPLGRHRGSRWSARAMLPGLLATGGEWRETEHQHGSDLVAVPAAMMSVLVARRARGAKRGAKR